ncbi:MAG: hypothetical protein ACKVP4_04795 [Hyphomicrobium sp.]
MTVCTPTRLLALAALAAAVSGCSNSGAPLATASVAPDKPVVAQPRVDPACVALASQIDTLRAEGTVERLEKAAAGKTANVQVKRASLAKQAELNKANADFQTRCGPAIPRAQTATMAPPSGVTPSASPRKIDAAPVGN